MVRHLVKMYDHVRSENYDFDNCKHLACTEVRAANFNSKCELRRKSKMHAFLKDFKFHQEQMMANEYCVKDLAT